LASAIEKETYHLNERMEKLFLSYGFPDKKTSVITLKFMSVFAYARKLGSKTVNFEPFLLLSAGLSARISPPI
jgi:hypothetical protein